MLAAAGHISSKGRVHTLDFFSLHRSQALPTLFRGLLSLSDTVGSPCAGIGAVESKELLGQLINKGCGKMGKI